MLLSAIVAVACAGSARAHHSISMIDTTVTVWVKGEVVSYEPVAPHAMFRLEATNEDGQVVSWTIEGPFPGRLERILSLNRVDQDRALLQVGDQIEVCGFYPKGERAADHRYIHGHVLVMPDGHMQSWGPYGKMDNCVRVKDQSETWRAFLDSDPLARELWCGQRSSGGVGSSADEAVSDEISRTIANPCE